MAEKGEIHEITECPFKKTGTAADNLRSVCLKAGEDAHPYRNMTCVGEDNCPDMQTHRAVMAILGKIGGSVGEAEAGDKKVPRGERPRGCTDREIDC